MQKSMVLFNFSVSPEIPFLGKFCPKYQNHRFKLKFGTETNLNMQNSMVMLIFFCLWPEIPFLGKSGPKYQNCKIKLKFDTDSHFHNIFRLFMFYQIFLSPQVKPCAIITYKHGIYELPHELPNDLRTTKVSKLHRMIA